MGAECSLYRNSDGLYCFPREFTKHTQMVFYIPCTLIQQFRFLEIASLSRSKAYLSKNRSLPLPYLLEKMIFLKVSHPYLQIIIEDYLHMFLFHKI